MTKQETLLILATLKAAYPTYYRELPKTDAEAVVNLWAVQFADCGYKETMTAVHSLISSRTSNFPPTIGEVKQALFRIRKPGALSPGDAWAMVSRCISRGSVHSREDWELLPEVVRKAITPDEIRRMATDEDYNESVSKALFLKNFAVVQEREREREVVPAGIARMIEAKRQEQEQRRLETAAQKAPVEPPTSPVNRPEGFTPVDIRKIISEGLKGGRACETNTTTER